MACVGGGGRFRVAEVLHRFSQAVEERDAGAPIQALAGAGAVGAAASGVVVGQRQVLHGQLAA